MPVLFNEYCTTWGCPSAENVRAILKAIGPFPIDTFVIDCGWYKPDDKGWCNAIGDWRESRALFPEGISAVSDAIKAAGKHPGIWFEFEVAGRDSDCFFDESKLVKRDGHVITGKNRRFLDLRLPKVQEYLKEQMLAFLQKNGFEYIKIDYNDSLGIGCDSPDGAAPGEGGRQIAEESLVWLTKLREAVPGLVIENCSSGGSRIEPLRMSQVSMCSFSDAHECNGDPARRRQRLARHPRAADADLGGAARGGERFSRTVYSLTCRHDGPHLPLGRRAAPLGAERVRSHPRRPGVSTKQVKDVVRHGRITLIDNTVEYYRAPEGRQVYRQGVRGEKARHRAFSGERGERSRCRSKGTASNAPSPTLPIRRRANSEIEGRPFAAGRLPVGAYLNRAQRRPRR